jgi:hypothetical protein
VPVAVSGGVSRVTNPVNDIDGFRLLLGCVDVPTVGCMKVEVGEGADNVTGGTDEILDVDEAKPDSVATEEEEFDLVGLVPLGGAGNEGLDVVEGDGREYDVE